MTTPTNPAPEPVGLPPVKIVRGTFAELTIYEVADYELEILEHGSPDSLYLNFAIFLLSTAVSFFVALLTSFLTQRTFTVFVVITTVGFLMGIFLLIIWLKKRRKVSNLIKAIKDRLPPEPGFQLSADEAAGVFDDLTAEEAASLLDKLDGER